MDQLWSFWKSLCCSERNAFRSALFVKKYICCARNIYISTAPVEFSFPWKIFFAEGEVVRFNIPSQYSISMEDSRFKYDFKYNTTTIDSLQKEETLKFAICCGCPVEDPEDSLNKRPVTSKIIPRMEDDEHSFVLALRQLMENDREITIGLLRVRTWGQGEPQEERFIADRMREALQAVKFAVPFLECTIAEQGYKAWVELADYKHLSLRTSEKVEVTDKMLNCGFLSITAVMSNPEKLSEFKGFGLIIGFISKNGFTWDRLFEEIELWKNKTPSSFECFGLFDKSEIPRPVDLFDRLSAYSITGKLLKSEPEYNEIDVIMLDNENDAAIMSMNGTGVCFVRGGWVKWEQALHSLGESIVQFMQ